MIIFTHDLNLAYEIARRSNEYVIMNLSSSYSNFIDIASLITRFMQYMSNKPNIIVNTVQFDMEYAMAIQQDQLMYESLLKIIMNSYEGRTVIILVHRDDYRDAIMESIIKYIQEKYGHKSWIVEEIEDLELLREERFSPSGLINIDEEIRNYNDLYVKGQVNQLVDSTCLGG